MITKERYTVTTTWAGTKNIGSEVIDTEKAEVNGKRKTLLQCDSTSLALRIAQMLNDEDEILVDVVRQMNLLENAHRVRYHNTELPDDVRNRNRQAMEVCGLVRDIVIKANNRRNLT